MKQILDFVLALVGLLVLAPLLLTTAVAVSVTSRGPALFCQERVGQGGRRFRMWKFRTMSVTAEEELAAVLHEHGCGDEPMFKVRQDPRITALGRLLRRWSLDELPQLWNVVRGDMSLVGPRPPLVWQAQLYTPRQWRRLSVRPGITGLWQISGRSELPWRQAVELDLHYVEDWALTWDLRILIRTIGAVVSGRGAY